MPRLLLLLVGLLCILCYGNDLVHASNLQDNGEREPIMAILSNYRTIQVIDTVQDEAQKITLPVEENYHPRSVAISHDGIWIVYTSENESTNTTMVRVFNRLTEVVALEYEITGFDLRIPLRTSNFSMDDTKLAFGYNDADLGSWRIVVFNIETGQLIRTIADGDFPNVRIQHGVQSFIYRFAHDIITFINFGPYNSPGNFENATYDTLDWDLTSDTFTENCIYTHMSQITFDPSGEVIETATQPFLLNTGDADVPNYGINVLQYVESGRRQVFFRHEHPLFSAQFVQSGERLVAIGRPDATMPIINRMMLIERDGTMIDELDVEGYPYIRPTRDGFVYQIFQDAPGWVTELMYVNTRESSPFANRTLIWQSEPDEYYTLLWADDGLEDELPTYMPWGDIMTDVVFECPRNHG